MTAAGGAPCSRRAAAPTCHYQVLGIPSVATQEEIKTAHRRLARRLHPDKQQQQQQQQQQPGCSHSNHPPPTNFAPHDELFRKVQSAWECLRDPIKKKQYDEDRQRNRDTTHSRSHGAIRIRLSEMVECVDEEDAMAMGYAHECRCGEMVEVWNDDEQQGQQQQHGHHSHDHDQVSPLSPLSSSSATATTTTTPTEKDILLECPNCSLMFSCTNDIGRKDTVPE